MSQSPRLSDDQLNRLAAVIEKRPEVASLIGYPVAAAAFLDLRDARRAAIPSPAAPSEGKEKGPGRKCWAYFYTAEGAPTTPVYWSMEAPKEIQDERGIWALMVEAPGEKGKEEGGPVATLPEASPREVTKRGHPADHAFVPDAEDVSMCGECGWEEPSGERLAVDALRAVLGCRTLKDGFLDINIEKFEIANNLAVDALKALEASHY